MASRPYLAWPLVLAGMSQAWPGLPTILWSAAALTGSFASSSAVNLRPRSPLATISPYEIERLPATTAPPRATQSAGVAPISLAPASIMAIRPAAPAWL